MRVSSLLVVIVFLASLTPDAADSPYRVVYPNGVTVEVVAVSVMPSRNKPFWSPDGRRLVGAPFETRAPGLVREAARMSTYEVVARIVGAKEQPIYIDQRAINGVTIGYGITPFMGAQSMNDLRVFDCSVPPGTEELVFELGIAANDWRTVQTFTKPGAYGSGPGRVEVNELPARGSASPEGNPWFNVKLAAAEGEMRRLVALDDAGASHVSTGRYSIGRDGHWLQGLFPGLARDRVREFRLQTCSYQWQVVKGIRLKPPGGEIDAVVARHRVEGLLGQEAKFKPGDAARVQDAIERAVRTRVFENVDEWAGAVRELAEIGAPAVPAIVNEIRRTARPYGRSALAIALRAIDDPRAVPGLAEALADAPFGGSDYGGARAKDLALSYFMASLWRERDSVGVGTFPMRRPVNEITYSLEYLTGHTVGNQHQRRNERALFENAAARWRDWWEQNRAAATAGLPVLRVANLAGRGRESLTPTIPDAARLAADLKADPKLGSRPVLGRWTLLHLAIAHGRSAEVDALITGGADVNAAGEDGWTPLHLAAALGHGNAVENLLDHNVDVVAKTADGTTPLHAAAGECFPPVYAPLPRPDRAVIEMLLGKGGDPKAADGRGRTPLHGIAAAGDGVLLKLFLDRNAPIDAKDARGRTPLHRAVECDNESVADVLLLQGADVNAGDESGRTPIRYASFSLYFPQDAPPLVRRLLEHGAEVNLATTILYGSVEDLTKAINRNPAAVKEMPAGPDDMPAIHWAIRAKSPERLKLLVDAGADVNAQHGGNSPLHTAVFAGDVATVKMLIAAKADVDAKGNATPLYWACQRLSVELVEELLAAGANPRSTEGKDSYSPMQAVLQAARENDRMVPGTPQEKLQRGMTILKALLAKRAGANDRGWTSGYTPIFSAGAGTAEVLHEAGAKLDVTNDEGDTPLHYAAVLGRTELAQFLLKHKVPLEARNKKGETPLHKAVGYFEPQGGVFELLLEHKSDLAAKDGDGRTPLHRAVMIASVKATTELLEKGADPKAKDKEGATPLHHAAKNGRDAVIPLLAKHGAPLNDADANGQTPLQWATSPKTRDLLIEHGAKK